MLSDALFKRYQRLICLPEIGESGQKKLCDASVLIIGCGGLGNAAALYLAASGIGKLVICDDDVVEASNLSRQVAFRNEDLDTAKVVALAQQLRRLNPHTDIRTVQRRMDETSLPLEVTLADVVLDCSDNLDTRHLINQVCFYTGVPLISGAAIGWNGQIIAFDFSASSVHQGCYACMVPKDTSSKINNCSEMGVVGPVVGTIGNYQALLTLQYLVGLTEYLPNHLYKFDGKSMDWRKLKLLADPDCPVCAGRQETISQREEILQC